MMRAWNKVNDFEENISIDKIQDFILSFNKYDEELSLLKDYAIKNKVPIIRDETKDFLNMVLRIKKPRNILELGTAIGYSTLVIYKAIEGHFDSFITIEEDETRVREARNNIDKFCLIDKVNLIEADIGKYLIDYNKNETFDFIFLDAAKAQYVVWLPYIKKLMKKGAILIADNIFKDGEVLESKYYIIKRDRTIHKRMREFLHIVSSDCDLDTNLFNLGDGISVSIKK